MITKLILLEGIPGSGKSTFARKIADWYQNRGKMVNLYIEGQSHPADLGWNACVPYTEYDGILQRYESLRAEIENNTVFENGTAIIAYTQIKTDNRNFYKELEAFEVYDGRVSDEKFFKLHYDRWRSFGRNAECKDELNIFECAFMQNHVNELLFWRNANDRAVIAHHNRLLDSVKSLSPALIYLSQPDIRETIQRIAKERVSKDNGNWIDSCIAYCENSPFGRRNGIKELEMKILTQLSIPHIVVENYEYDWDNVWTQIETYLIKLQGESDDDVRKDG